MAVAKARLLKPIHIGYFDVSHRGMVIGGGIAGMTDVLSLAEQGFEVFLVERSEKLGGNLHHVKSALGGADSAVLLSMTDFQSISNLIQEDR